MGATAQGFYSKTPEGQILPFINSYHLQIRLFILKTAHFINPIIRQNLYGTCHTHPLTPILFV
ncbi:hypothetical protein PO909_030475 [Leuciscus waleckii]